MLHVHPAQLDSGTAAALGALQGVAEFLPISSSGHLSLAQSWLGLDPEAAGHSFNIILHAGTLLAVLLVYRRDLIDMLWGLLRPDEAAERSRIARATFIALILGTLPLGLVLLPGVEDIVVGMEGKPRLVGVALLVTAAILGFSHRRQPPLDTPNEPPTRARSVWIGLAQLAAVLPGISRSGATIAAGLALGMGRARAARFSFLLSIPAILGATAKEVATLISHFSAAAPAAAEATNAAGPELTPFLVGFAVSFITGLVALRALLKLIERLGMLPFVPYLVILGTIALAME